MEIVTQNELVSINATLIIQVISFLIFLFLIQRVMFRPLRQTMEARNGHIRQLRQEIRDQEAKLSELSFRIKKEEAALKTEAFLEFGKSEADGKQAARDIRRQVRAEIREQQQKTATDIRIQIETVRQQLLSETEPLVVTILERVLGRRLPS
jgi:F-type H+-transporting ATPase subunit b